MLAPIFEELANQYEGKAEFVKVNVDEEPELANEFHIMSIPTLVVMKDGQVLRQSMGAKPKSLILDMLK